MFPLMAVSAFFILGISFFAIGKDDFGIKQIKEVSNDTSSTDKEVLNSETISEESNKGKDEIIADSLKDQKVTTNISD